MRQKDSASKKPAPQGRGTSKRQGWTAATFYLKPETLAQLRRVVTEGKLEGETGDLSDAVEEALEDWLSQQGKQPPRRQASQPLSLRREQQLVGAVTRKQESPPHSWNDEGCSPL